MLVRRMLAEPKATRAGGMSQVSLARSKAPMSTSTFNVGGPIRGGKNDTIRGRCWKSAWDGCRQEEPERQWDAWKFYLRDAGNRIPVNMTEMRMSSPIAQVL